MIRAAGLLIIITVLVLMSLAGCGGPPAPPMSVRPPPGRCMASPAPLAALKAGDDLVVKHADLRRSYGRETSKERCLQRYVRAVRKGHP